MEYALLNKLLSRWTKLNIRPVGIGLLLAALIGVCVTVYLLAPKAPLKPYQLHFLELVQKQLEKPTQVLVCYPACIVSRDDRLEIQISDREE